MNTSIAIIAPEARIEKLTELQTKINIRLQQRALELTKSVMENMPEYCTNPWFRICDCDYENKTYTFQVASINGGGEAKKNTPETTVTVDELSKTMPMFYMAVLAGTLGGLCITDENFWDAGAWDADVLDAFLQYHFYNDTVFG